MAIRIRTWSGQPKYIGIAGGAKVLYWSDETLAGHPLLITEGEFDCLIAYQVAQKFALPLSVISLASASNSRIAPYWYLKLLGAPTLFARMDKDKAGQHALHELQKLSASVRAVQVPECKDINDYFLKAGEVAVCQWLNTMLD